MKNNSHTTIFSRKKSAKLLSIAALGLILAITSCRKDDEGQAAPKVSPLIENSNTTATPITDATISGGVLTPSTTTSVINFGASGTIKDLSKMYLELNVNHNWAGDLSFALRSPDGTEKSFLYRIGIFDSNLGSSVDYSAANTLTFNNTYTAVVPFSASPVPAGNYKETIGVTNGGTITLEPIFSSFNGKQVNGNWTLVIKDYINGDTGQLVSWKLKFAEGALQQ